MPKFDPCVCCGGGCCTVGAHPKIPPAGSLVPIAAVDPTVGFTDNVWTTVEDWVSWTGQSWGVAAFNIIGGVMCDASYQVRLLFTDLCFDESPTQPIPCGTCTEGNTNVINIASGYICASVVRGVPQYGPFTFGWACKFRKVELQIKFDWSCSTWANPGSFSKCTDAQITNSGSFNVTVPADPGIWSQTLFITPFPIKAACTLSLCTPYLFDYTINFTGGPLTFFPGGLSNIYARLEVVGFSPPGTVCVVANNSSYWYPFIIPPDAAPPVLPFCTACQNNCPIGRMLFFTYLTKLNAVLYRDFPPSFPGTVRLGFYYKPICCDAAVTMTLKLSVQTAVFPP